MESSLSQGFAGAQGWELEWERAKSAEDNFLFYLVHQNPLSTSIFQDIQHFAFLKQNVSFVSNLVVNTVLQHSGISGTFLDRGLLPGLNITYWCFSKEYTGKIGFYPTVRGNCMCDYVCLKMALFMAIRIPTTFILLRGCYQHSCEINKVIVCVQQSLGSFVSLLLCLSSPIDVNSFCGIRFRSPKSFPYSLLLTHMHGFIHWRGNS